MNIILYGNKNQGKTTTLVRLAIMLASGGGINPLIESQVNRKFKKRKGYKDARFVIEYKEKGEFVVDKDLSNKVNNDVNNAVNTITNNS